MPSTPDPRTDGQCSVSPCHPTVSRGTGQCNRCATQAPVRRLDRPPGCSVLWWRLMRGQQRRGAFDVSRRQADGLRSHQRVVPARRHRHGHVTSAGRFECRHAEISDQPIELLDRELEPSMRRSRQLIGVRVLHQVGHRLESEPDSENPVYDHAHQIDDRFDRNVDLLGERTSVQAQLTCRDPAATCARRLPWLVSAHWPIHVVLPFRARLDGAAGAWDDRTHPPRTGARELGMDPMRSETTAQRPSDAARSPWSCRGPDEARRGRSV